GTPKSGSFVLGAGEALNIYVGGGGGGGGGGTGGGGGNGGGGGGGGCGGGGGGGPGAVGGGGGGGGGRGGGGAGGGGAATRWAGGTGGRLAREVRAVGGPAVTVHPAEAAAKAMAALIMERRVAPDVAVPAVAAGPATAVARQALVGASTAVSILAALAAAREA